jgi:hypothetical protein
VLATVLNNSELNGPFGGGSADAEMRLSVLKVSCFRTLTVFIGLTDKIKPPEGGFGNAFGNKSVESLQTLAIPIDLADATSAMTAIDPKQSFA